MSFSRWIENLFRRPARRRVGPRSRRLIPTFEILEDRVTPTGNVLTVTSLQDAATPSQGTLRYALAENVADSGGDTIVFEPQLQSTLTVATPLNVAANVTIIGNIDTTTGLPLVAISGGNSVQVWNVNPSLSNVNFANLEFKDGTTNSGGGIFIGKSSTVTFNNVTIDHNSANSGGGVFVASGGNVSFTNSAIDNNTAGGPIGDEGGGLFIQGSSIVHITDSEVNGNTAIADGGGLFVAGNGTVAGNAKVTIDTVNETPPKGLSFVPGQVRTDKSGIESQVNNNNATTFGGAISSYGTVTINSQVPTAPTQVNLNTSAGSSGGIRSFNGTGGNPGPGTPADANLTISNSVVDFNTATASEGGIYAQGLVTFTNMEIGQSRAGQNAGGFAFSGPPGANVATLTNVTVDQNQSAGDTAGINNYGNMVILDSTIWGNVAGSEVGGIRDNAGTLWLINSTVANNNANGASASSDDAGGLLVDGGVMHIINSTIAGNATANGRGGGILLEAPQATTLTFTMQNSIVATNKAAGEASGPDIFVFSSAPNDTYNVQYSLIGDGSALVSNGSAIAVNGVNGNQVGGTGSPINPQLGPLQNNGGPIPNPSFTMALQPNSPAVDAGNNALAVDSQNNQLQFDQRGKGFPRIINGTVDLGAFEYGVPITITPTTLPTGFVNVPYSQQITASGGSGHFSFSVSSGSLPPGLTLDPNGLLHGTPTTTAGSPFTFTVTATDNGTGATGNQAYNNMVIDGQLFINGTLKQGTINKAYSATLTGSGGSGSGYTISESGPLPNGITATPSGGTLTFSGTPSVTGSFPISVTLTDSTGGSLTKNYTLTINAVLALPSTPAPPAAIIGAPYSFGFTATGGSGGYTYAESGTLPSGIGFNSNGTLTGSANNAAQVGSSFPFSVTVTDSSGATATTSYTLKVENPITVTSPASLPNGEVTLAYVQGTPFSASGGAGGPYSFTESGALPTGMSLSGNTLTGTPGSGTAGTYTVTITPIDGSGAVGTSKMYSLTIIAAPTLRPATLPAGTATVPYTQTLTASGGSGPAYVITGPGTVDGLTFTDNGNGTATISGTPTSAGSFPYTVRVKDGAGVTGTVNYTLTVNKPLSIATNPSPFPAWAAVNGPYSVSFIASGGSGTGYTYSESGPLPPGIGFSGNTVSGSTAPTAFGTYTFTITATDSIGTPGQQTYTINIEPQIVISPTSLPPGTIGNTYVQPTPLSASGGSGSGLRLVGETGALPNGMIFNPGTGYFVGTPTQYGNFPITVTATDSNGGFGTQPYTLVINFSLGNTANAKFVTSVYQKLLDRNPDAGAQTWVNLLNAGVAPSAVVKTIEGSTEYLTDLTGSIYQHYLGRGLDPGAGYWVSQLASGASIQSVTAHILASMEYFNKQQARFGNADPNVNFIMGLYQDVLGRTPSNDEINGWLSFIAAGVVRNGSSANALSATRFQIALDFLTSQEYYSDLVGGGGIWNGSYPLYPWSGFYQEFLGRPADAGGLASWVGALQGGMSEQSVLAAIFGSREGYLFNS